ncbi:dual specificity protein phosphatase 3-like [Mytilus trossulus]|uniref:dual specificity protein phosphatase 3-like n=1 Tax=Mytilus trossulus TaxID=6551 RepID=UPI003006CB9D
MGSYDVQLCNEVLMYFMDRKADGADSNINEVYKNLFVGNEVIARDAAKLKELGINLVINLSPNEVKTNPLIYEPYDIKYCPLSSDDNVYTCLLNIVEDCADLIEDTIKDGGKVLVHCSGGVRKSPAMAIAYLMLKEQLPIWNAVKCIRRCRKVCPSNGLIMQLCILNKEIFEKVTHKQIT